MSQFTVDQALQIGLQYQQKGQLPEAEDIYRQILEVFPDQPDALHLLGVLAHQCNKNDIAEEFIRKAIASAPSTAPVAPYRLSLGSVLQAQNQHEQAIKLYQETVAANPAADGIADVYSHLGVALSARGRFQEAVDAFQNALQREPNHPAANGNLGIALCHLGRDQDAIRVLRAAVAHQPNVPAFHASLGAALYRAGQFEAAAAACHQAIALDPNHGQANQMLSMVYVETGRLAEAAAAAKIAADSLSELVDAQLHYGDVLAKLGRLDDAASHHKNALKTHPTSADLHTNYANILKDQGLLDEALVAYKKAIELKPGSAPFHSNYLYALQFHGATSPNVVFEEHRQFDLQHAQPLRAQFGKGRPHPNDKNPNRRLRIGYISNEFRGHVIGLNLLPLLGNHDKQNFDIYCYHDVPKPDFFTYRFQQCADHWTSIVGKNDQQVADLVRADQIDILVDLSLHLGGNRLLVLARKPAPVQVSFAGYPGTTGLSAIDYRFTDPYLDPPPPATHNFPSSETPIRLRDSFWCYHPLHDDIPVNTLPAKDLGYITFGNFNNFCKINDKTLELWALVMRGVTRSRLIMLTPEGSHRIRTQRFLEKQGIALDRVDFVPRMPSEKYLRAYHRIDLGLDSFPYNGHTTSLDSSYMGVPVVTIIGNTPVSRAGWCQLSNMGMPELAAKTPSEFVKIATELANNWPRLAEYRATLRRKMAASPLMDQKRFAESIELAYRELWINWCKR
jgi:predicted O-linked N-acetylglucosamine transferase (SPINDLY family)